MATEKELRTPKRSTWTTALPSSTTHPRLRRRRRHFGFDGNDINLLLHRRRFHRRR